MSSSTGSNGEPQYSSGDAPALAATFNELADYALERGGLLRGTTAQRTAFSTAGYASEGDHWYDTTLDKMFLFDGLSWVSASATHAVAGYAATAGTPVNPASGIAVRTGLASGTTSGTGVLVHTFPTAFPNACIGVIFMPNQNKGAPSLVENDVTKTGFNMFYSGAPNAGRSIQYIAFGY